VRQNEYKALVAQPVELGVLTAKGVSSTTQVNAMSEVK
jgi:hypothetical protein